jgi:hypothetical protein
LVIFIAATFGLVNRILVCGFGKLLEDYLLWVYTEFLCQKKAVSENVSEFILDFIRVEIIRPLKVLKQLGCLNRDTLCAFSASIVSLFPTVEVY